MFVSDEKDISPKDYLEKNRRCISIMKDDKEDIFKRINKIANCLGQSNIHFDWSLLVDVCHTFQKSINIADYLSFSEQNRI